MESWRVENRLEVAGTNSGFREGETGRELSVMECQTESPDLSSVSAINGYVVITEVRQSEVTAQMKLCMAIPSL